MFFLSYVIVHSLSNGEWYWKLGMQHCITCSAAGRMSTKIDSNNWSTLQIDIAMRYIINEVFLKYPCDETDTNIAIQEALRTMPALHNSGSMYTTSTQLKMSNFSGTWIYSRTINWPLRKKWLLQKHILLESRVFLMVYNL